MIDKFIDWVGDHPVIGFSTIFVVIMLIIFVPVYILDSAEERDMAEHKCVQTAESKTETVLMPIVISTGNTTMVNIVPQTNTYYKYVCDNGVRWH